MTIDFAAGEHPSMITQFSWIDASKLPALAETARQQPVRDCNGQPTPGGLVCPVAASQAMAVTLCAPVMHPMHAALIQRCAKLTCNACGAKAPARAAKCPACDVAPVPRAAFAADAIERATWIKFGTPSMPPRHVLALRHVIAPELWARPTQTMPDGRPSDDHLTTHLACIVRTDNRCRKTKAVHGAQSVAHAAARHHLQRTVHKYFGFAPPLSKKKPGRDIVSPGSDTGLKHRLNGKTGRMRASLLGWRLGDVARCVAQPAPPDMPVDTVIVPQHIAKCLGNMQDGAVCLLNRQPTLGVGSIFAVRVRVSRNPHSYVMQVSTWLCASLNLDFDGDEVNLHHITDPAARYEALLLCGVDAIMRCNITGRVRIQPCHAHRIANWLSPSIAWSQIGTGHPVSMLHAMQESAANAETVLRRRAVTIGLSDMLPLRACSPQVLENVPKTSHVAHLAQAMRRMPPRGGLADLIRSGAKGKFTHLVQLRCCLGQQLRWSDTYSTNKGYIDRCFAQGLTVHQAVDHAMSARVGQVDQAVKTRTVGYLRRRLMALLENVTIEHDGTARLVSHDVVQFRHADNFEAGDAAGCMAATILGHAAFQASLDAFKHTDAASMSAPGLPAFLRMVAAPSTAASDGTWSAHDAASGVPRPCIALQVVVMQQKPVTRRPTPLMLMTRQVMGWTRPKHYVKRVRQINLRVDAMLMHGIQPHDVAWAVRRCNVNHASHYCTIAPDGRSVLLWDDVAWNPAARVAGCSVTPSSTPCAVQAQRLMDARHVTSCCVATQKVLGVEAAREMFVRMSVHHLGLQHAMPAVQLAADVLFWPGHQIPLTRNGLQQQLPAHALCRAAYETTISVFADAATKRSLDPCTTVSARVCRRQPPQLGTHGPSRVFTTQNVVEKPPRHKAKDTVVHPGYEVFNFLQPEMPPQKCRNKLQHSKPKKSRWADAPWQPASLAC